MSNSLGEVNTLASKGIKSTLDAAAVPNLEVDPRLVEVFGDPVPAAELRIWAAMTPAKRAQVLQRIAALDRYCGEEGKQGLTAKQAAADAGVKVGRFYQIARIWPKQRSLSSLGTFASVTGPRQRYDAEVVNALQAAVTEVVKGNDGRSVAALVRLLAERSGLPAQMLPKTNTLRLFVEREQRRLRKAKLAGDEVLFDCVVTSLPRAGGEWHSLFVVIDRGTRLIMGYAVGNPQDSVRGYRAAAADALRRILAFSPSRAIWSPRLERSQLVPGIDGEALARITGSLTTEIGSSAPQMVGASTYGRYVRKHLGLRLGPIQLVPARTGKKPTQGGNRGDDLVDSDAEARLELAVADHNSAILSELHIKGEIEPPGELVRLFELLARA